MPIINFILGGAAIAALTVPFIIREERRKRRNGEPEAWGWDQMPSPPAKLFESPTRHAQPNTARGEYDHA